MRYEPWVSKARIPSVELKHVEEDGQHVFSHQVSKARIPSVELKLLLE